MTSTATKPNRAPRRVLIAQKFASLGGAQVSLVHHIKLLDRSRFEPYVVVSNEGWLTKQLDALGVSWSLMKFGHWTNPLAFPGNARLVWRLRRVIREQQIELVHANEHWVGPPAYYAARLTKIPSICHFRTGLEDLTPARVRKYLYRYFDRVIVVAEVLRQAIVRNLPDPSRVFVVRDGVEPPAAAPSKRRSRRRKIIINVGALYEVKGQAKILERSLPWLKENRSHYLVFVGGTRTAPSYVDDMRRLVAHENLQRQVLFLGSREDVPRLLGMADALVAYSTVEGIPRVVMEAMFAGLPVIVSNTPGMDEVVSGEVGAIVNFEAKDNELAGALRDLSSRPEHWVQLGQQAYSRALDRYSTQAMSAGIQSIYTALLEKPADA